MAKKGPALTFTLFRIYIQDALSFCSIKSVQMSVSPTIDE